ncbi:T9SS type A sorting domain-containing protein [Chryseobacterium sp. Mn2064]|uniref:T9SS type A sorting domain-containing protein n=1 Tax=Chryseobacterium sp. Mn2064 TaxID=3395263 RepID=UPI003BD28930
MKKLYFLLLLFVSYMVFAQTYSYTTYNTSNSAIGSNYIADIKTDANGLLWLATYNGVSTFNGTTFTNYSTTNSGIASNAIVKIEIDGQNRKWIASQFNGIILYNGTSWTNYTTSNSGLPSNEIIDIAVDGQNNLWVVTPAGLTKFNGTTWATYNSVSNMNSVATDGNNGVWVTNGGVLYKFNGTDFNFIAQGTQKILRIANNTIYVKGSDSLITLTTSGTNITFNYQNNSCLAAYNPNALDVDSNSKVWVGFNGAGLQNFTNCTTYTKTNTNSGLPDDYFSAVRTQSSGTIWLGTLQLGLVKMTPSAAVCNPPAQMYPSNITSTSATLNWLPSTSAPNGGYYYVYSTSPTMTGSATAASSTTANVANLLPNTTYYWWVAANCVTSQSTWVSGGAFTTLPAQTGCWKTVSAGRYHSLGIKMDGTLWAWGSNSNNQLGDGTSIQRNNPVQIGTATNWKKIFPSEKYSVAIKEDGTLWAWGNNQFGFLGDGTTTNRTVPTKIGTATDWEYIAVGGSHTIGIKSNGTLWAWGMNLSGELGDGTTTNRLTPTQIGTGSNWKSIAAGTFYSVGVKTDGTLWAWGYNGHGQLGDGTFTDRIAPKQIGTDTNWAEVVAGNSHTAGRRTNGLLYTWGFNVAGQLADGGSLDKATPFLAADGIEKVFAGDFNTTAITMSGYVIACGSNSTGSFGNNTNTSSSNWVNLGSNSHMVLSTGGLHTLSVNNDGILKACGANNYGQLGDGTTVEKNTFIQLVCPVSSLAVEEISPVSDHLKVFPNPVQDFLNVSFDKNIASVEVYNAVGQQVLVKIINNNKGQVDFSALPSGVYMVKINAANNVVKMTKVIKR